MNLLNSSLFPLLWWSDLFLALPETSYFYFSVGRIRVPFPNFSISFVSSSKCLDIGDAFLPWQWTPCWTVRISIFITFLLIPIVCSDTLLHISTEHWLPCCTLIFEAGNGWEMVRGDQSMTWVVSMRTLTSELTRIDAAKLPGWGPWVLPSQWLETSIDMA